MTEHIKDCFSAEQHDQVRDEEEVKRLREEIARLSNLVNEQALEIANLKAQSQPLMDVSVDSLVLPENAPTFYSEWRKKSENKSQTIIDFLLEVWKPWMDAKVLTRRDLRRLDPSADKAVDNWLLRHPLPENIYLPTKKQVNDQILTTNDGKVLREAWRITALHRRRRGGQITL